VHSVAIAEAVVVNYSTTVPNPNIGHDDAGNADCEDFVCGFLLSDRRSICRLRRVDYTVAEAEDFDCLTALKAIVLASLLLVSGPTRQIRPDSPDTLCRYVTVGI
jgi:hypothetical protein